MFRLRFPVKEGPGEFRITTRQIQAATLDEAFETAEKLALEMLTSIHIVQGSSQIVAQVGYAYATHSTTRRVI